MLNSIKLMFQALDENNIVYCHWKSNEHLKAALNGDTDLDMLFLPESRSKLDQVLNGCGLKRFNATPLSQYNAIEDYIGFDEDEGKIWHLHLHYRLTIGEKHLKGYTINSWGPYLLKNRLLTDDNVYISCPEDELILLYVRMALKMRWRDLFSRIGTDDIVESKWLIERIDSSKFEDHVKHMLGEKYISVFREITSKKMTKKKSFYPLQKELRRTLAVFTGYSILSSYLRRLRREVYWFIGGIGKRLKWDRAKPYSRVSPSGGAVIAFLGSDGAGKSTTIEYVRKELSKKLDVKTVYLGSGDGSSSLLRKPMKLIAKKVGGKGLGTSVEKEYESSSNYKKVSIKARMYSIAKIVWAITLANEKNKKLRKITKARNNGLIVLLDRYPQVQTMGYGDGPLLYKYIKDHGIRGKLARKELYIYQSFSTNHPDLTIKLMVPTKVAIERKPEMTAEEIDRKKQTVMEINPSERSVIIDTAVDKKISFSQVLSEIWKII
jgi:thymidylate kinase